MNIFISYIVLLLLTINQILYQYLFFNFTFKIKDNLSMNPSSLQIHMFYSKIIVVFYHIQFDLSNSTTYIYYLVLHLIKGSILYYNSLVRFPYHQKNVSKTYGIFSSAYLWINSVFIVLYIIQE